MSKDLTDARALAAKVLGHLPKGNADSGLPPSPAAVSASLTKVVSQWKGTRGNIDTILANE